MKIIRAKYYGFCFWVKRAYSMVQERLKEKWKIQVWWELIHNKPALDLLKKQWMIIVENFSDITWEIIIRSHWISEKTLSKIKNKTNDIKNATCPYVIAVHSYAKQFEKEGRVIVIIWDWNHPEMIWVKEDLANPICLLTEIEAKQVILPSKIWVVVQTTLKTETFNEILNILKKKCDDIKVKNTICSATTERQTAIIKLANKCDIVIVIWWKKSSNSNKLFELSSEICETKKIEFSTELRKSWFKWKNIIWISAWASTPDWLIDEVQSKIETY